MGCCLPAMLSVEMNVLRPSPGTLSLASRGRHRPRLSLAVRPCCLGRCEQPSRPSFSEGKFCSLFRFCKIWVCEFFKSPILRNRPETPPLRGEEGCAIRGGEGGRAPVSHRGRRARG